MEKQKQLDEILNSEQFSQLIFMRNDWIFSWFNNIYNEFLMSAGAPYRINFAMYLGKVNNEDLYLSMETGNRIDYDPHIHKLLISEERIYTVSERLMKVMNNGFDMIVALKILILNDFIIAVNDVYSRPKTDDPELITIHIYNIYELFNESIRYVVKNYTDKYDLGSIIDNYILDFREADLGIMYSTYITHTFTDYFDDISLSKYKDITFIYNNIVITPKRNYKIMETIGVIDCVIDKIIEKEDDTVVIMLKAEEDE